MPDTGRLALAATHLRRFLPEHAGWIGARLAGLLGGALSLLVAFAVPAAAQPSGPVDAPVTLVEYSDFRCPYCVAMRPALSEILAEYGDRLRWEFRHFPLSSDPDDWLPQEAALAAAAQGRFREMHDLLFARRGRMDLAELREAAEGLGLDAGAFAEALASGRYRASVRRDIESGRARGVTGTPALFINGRRLHGPRTVTALKARVEEALAGGGSPEGATPPELAPAGAPSLGALDAPVTIVEFADFQCPYCARAASVMHKVMARFHGQVRWVFRHYPLDFHRRARPAHAAALAAARQGRFWEMHDRLFADPRRLEHADLIRHARRSMLDMGRFLRDLEDPGLRRRIDRDRSAGEALGVDGTPTFFINETRLDGAPSLEVLAGVVERELAAREDPAIPAGDRWVRGPGDAAVSVVIYGDFQSAPSAEAAWTLRGFQLQHPGQIQVRFRHYPLAFHSEAALAHQAAIEAGEQGHFWEMHDLLFANPGRLEEAHLLGYAARLGLDRARFAAALEGRIHSPRLRAQLLEGRREDVRGVPTLFVNGERFDGAPSRERLAELVAGAASDHAADRRPAVAGR